MNRNSIIAVIVVVLALFGVFYLIQQDIQREEPTPTGNENSVPDEIDTEIRAQVTGFGSKLKNVSLLQSPTDIKSQIQTHYKDYLSAELLAGWQANPSIALGRNVSSPWPDRIEIVEVADIGGGIYRVEGNVIEITSADKPLEPAAVYPVTFTVEKMNGAWLITSVQKGAYSELPARTTVIGFWECLPHKNPGDFQTLECAFGIALDQSDGHLAVDTSLMSSQPVDFPTRTKVKIEGIMTPANQLNSDMWQKYDIDGIISATTIEKVQ